MTNKVRNGNISEITLDAANANDGTPRGRKLLGKSVEKTGLGRSVVLDKNLQAIGGNKTVEVAADLDLEEVIFVHTTGNQLVAVVRDDLDLSDPTGQARQMAYYDNYVGQASLSWSPEQVKADMAAGLDLSDVFLDRELKKLGVATGGDESDAHPQTSRAAELQVEWGTAAGQVWRFPSRTNGQEHRLICGDCTDDATVKLLLGDESPLLMVTDPPYGVDYASIVNSRVNQKGGGWDKLEGDALSDEALKSLLVRSLHGAGAKVSFVWHPAGRRRRRRFFWEALEENGWNIRQEIVWIKNSMVFGRADYQWRHECCIYSKREGAPRQDDRTQTTVWEIDKPSGGDHPTAKPLDIYHIPLRNHTSPGDIMYEPFCGSGSGVLACENLARQCRAIEIVPSYAAVTLQRYLDAFGIRAELVED